MTPAARSVLIAGAVLMATAAWLAGQPRAELPPLRVSKTGVPVARPSPPLARDVLAVGGLALNPAQREELGGLATAWDRESTALEASVRAASAEFDRFAANTRAEGRTSLVELQRQSAELRELSAELRARRELQSDAALAVLTHDQDRQFLATRGDVR